MRAELEQKDIDAIATKVVELIKPLLINISKADQSSLLDLKGLAEYLNVKESWVYDQIKHKKITYTKMGKYLRFKKSAIDKYLESRTIKPIIY
jgi:excisionase family DNA binding protein